MEQNSDNLNNKGIFHVDMSKRIYENKTIGIAVVESKTKVNYGCALKGNLIKLIKKRLFNKNIYYDSAKLYAICIFLLIKDIEKEIKTLIICNDEDFNIIKKYLEKLLKSYFEIINITEFRKRLGRKVGSLADNYAKIYRKRALKPSRRKGKQINVININFRLIKQYWEKIK